MQLGFTWFDLAALAVLALSGVMAFARGLIREVFSIVGFFGGVVAALFLNEMARPLVEAVTAFRGFVASLAAGLIIFLIVYIAVTIVISGVAKTVHKSAEIGSFDRAAGLAFGILRGIVFVALVPLWIHYWSHQNADADHPQPESQAPESIVNARTYPIYDSVATAMEKFLPGARQRASAIIQNHVHPDESAPATTTSSTQAQPGGATTH